MRIAQLAPLYVPVPPTDYGGTERIVYTLTEELVNRGHDVTLFAAGGSKTSARLLESAPEPLWDSGGSVISWHAVEIERLIKCSGEFDVIHSHIDVMPWLGGDRYRCPLVTTTHGRLDQLEQRVYFQQFPGWPLVSISNAQRRPVRDLHLNWAATVYHGLDLGEMYRLGEGRGGYLSFVSRISPEKGPAVAIRVARAAGMKLVMAGPIPDEAKDFFDSEVQPLIDEGGVEYVGSLDDEGKNDVIGNSAGFLVPIQWDEPFGLAFIEALATGTPVISCPRGSLPELIESGKHGFLVNDEEELVEAVGKLSTIDRRACRDYVLERFSPRRMAEGYERVYSDLARMD
ncbi:MAG TPA: glycosyltransferase family 4 protein [Candidatus Dormibacteraeota bacterium]|nr:glycosyltransferase family 4 protein [Candidatus Dormibacteraeota bacterium]